MVTQAQLHFGLEIGYNVGNPSEEGIQLARLRAFIYREFQHVDWYTWISAPTDLDLLL